MARKPSMDRLTGQLYHLPSIVGRLGLSIASAQKAFNADYVDNVAKLIGLVERTVGQAKDADAKAEADAVMSLLEALAPSRYQFTETTIDFSADIAETFDAGSSVGLGFGAKAVTVNAAFSIGYGYDYRAAARITSTIHAYPPDAEMTKTLLARAVEVRKDKLDLPELSEIDKEIWDSTAAIFNSLTGASVKKVDASDPTKDAAGSGGGVAS